MRCPTCGAETTKGARFCRACGALLVTNPEKTAANDAVSGGTHPRVAPSPPPAPVPVRRDERWAPEPGYQAGPRSRRYVVGAIVIAVIAAVGGGTVVAVNAARHRDDSVVIDDPIKFNEPQITQPDITQPDITIPPPPPTTTTQPRPGAPAIALINVLLRAEERLDFNTALMYDVTSRDKTEFLDGYDELVKQQFFLAQSPVLVAPRVWTVRFTLIAHNQDSSGRHTKVYCQLWEVNVATRLIHAVRKGKALSGNIPNWVHFNSASLPHCGPE